MNKRLDEYTLDAEPVHPDIVDKYLRGELYYGNEGEYVSFASKLNPGEVIRRIRKDIADGMQRIEGFVVVNDGKPKGRYKLVYNSESGPDPVGLSTIMGSTDRDMPKGIERVFEIQQMEAIRFLHVIDLFFAKSATEVACMVIRRAAKLGLLDDY